MREIEKKMLAAIRNGKNFNGNNTQVECHYNGKPISANSGWIDVQ